MRKSAEKYLTPPKVAEIMGVNACRVIGWILAGELDAINLNAMDQSKRPRYRVTPEALEQFQSKLSVNKPSAKAKKNRPCTATKYF